MKNSLVNEFLSFRKDFLALASTSGVVFKINANNNSYFLSRLESVEALDYVKETIKIWEQFYDSILLLDSSLYKDILEEIMSVPVLLIEPEEIFISHKINLVTEVITKKEIMDTLSSKLEKSIKKNNINDILLFKNEISKFEKEKDSYFYQLKKTNHLITPDIKVIHKSNMKSEKIGINGVFYFDPKTSVKINIPQNSYFYNNPLLSYWGLIREPFSTVLDAGSVIIKEFYSKEQRKVMH